MLETLRPVLPTSKHTTPGHMTRVLSGSANWPPHAPRHPFLYLQHPPSGRRWSQLLALLIKTQASRDTQPSFFPEGRQVRQHLCRSTGPATTAASLLLTPMDPLPCLCFPSHREAVLTRSASSPNFGWQHEYVKFIIRPCTSDVKLGILLHQPDLLNFAQIKVASFSKHF